jgi:hypothetical protein
VMLRPRRLGRTCLRLFFRTLSELLYVFCRTGTGR